MEITRRRFMTMFELINYLQERLPIPNSEAIRIAAIMCDEDQVKVVVGISEDNPLGNYVMTKQFSIEE